MKLNDILHEGIEDRHAELYGEFEELSKLLKAHPDFPHYKAQFERGVKEFAEGYEEDDDDLMYNGFEGMAQAVAELRQLRT